MNDAESPRAKVLIGVDGRQGGEDALALGKLLAGAYGAGAVVATVVPLPSGMFSGEHLDQVIADAEHLLEGAAEGFGDGDVAGTRVLVDSSPGAALHDLAEEEEPIALVIGSSHRGPVGRLLLGSAGAGLLTGAPSPIAIAPVEHANAGIGALRSIAVALKGEEQSWPALDVAVDLAQRTGAGLTLIVVAEPAIYGYGEAYTILSVRQYVTIEHQRAEQAMARAREQIPAGVEVTEHLITGEPGHLIAEQSGDFDLLVVGSRGYGPVRRVLLGSVSGHLSRHASCPLLVVPRAEDEDS